MIAIALAVMTSFSAEAFVYTYTFDDTPISEALARICRDHPEVNISFIYKELDHYRTSAKIETDGTYEALRQTIGHNPISVIKSGRNYYVEAFQRGRFRYTGRAVGSDREPVVAATVMLLNPKDSTVITYGITDGCGAFSIPCDMTEVIAKISCLGYHTGYRTCKSFDVETIVMTELPLALKTIKVEAENSATSTDKTIYRPTPRQKNAAQTAIDLLRMLAIPQVSVNLVDESVTTTTGNAVAIYINGLAASSEELQGLRTADVRNIEYLNFPTDPRFGANDHVLNIVTQRYEYGGYTKLSANENILVGLSSRTSVYSKFTFKSMLYDLYVGSSDHDIHHGGTSRSGEYRLNDADGGETIVRRNEESTSTHLRYDQCQVSFRAVYDSDNLQIANTIGMGFDRSPIAERMGKLTYTPAVRKDYEYTDNQPYTTRHLVWSGAYYLVLPHDFQLSVTPTANLGHTDYTYSYTSTIPDSRPILNVSAENYNLLRGSASLYKSFANRHITTVRIYGGVTRNKVRYSGSSPYDNDFRDSYAGLLIGYNFNNRRWRFDTNAALQWEKNGINGKYVSETYPLINLSARYSPSTHHSAQVSFHFGANYPDESVKTPNILQDNELMYKTGNPDLPLSRQVSLDAQYNWIADNRFSLTLFGRYYGERNLYVPIFEHYADGHALLKTFSSDQNYHRTQMGLSFNLKLLDGALQLAAQPSVSIFRYRGCYDISRTPFSLNSSLTWYAGRFFVQASYQTAMKTLQGNRAEWYRDRAFYQVQGGWSNANLNIRLSAINIFRGDWLAATRTLTSPLYSETMSQGGTNFHRRINLSVTYTFGYGKKLNRTNEVGEQPPAPSAILK